MRKQSQMYLLSLADITTQYRVTMNSDKEKAMTIYLPDKPEKFIEIENRLYVRLPKNLNNNNTPDSSNDHQKKIQFATFKII